MKSLRISGLHRWFTNLPPSATYFTYDLSTCQRNSCHCWLEMLVGPGSLKDPPPWGLWDGDTPDSGAHIHSKTAVQDHLISKSHRVKAWRQEDCNSNNSHLWYKRDLGGIMPSRRHPSSLSAIQMWMSHMSPWPKKKSVCDKSHTTGEHSWQCYSLY